ncbi:MAG: glutathione S-transferase, partial [Pseudomonadota bacterium]|nr:glutathione S-transferase [Pseudomonadota bacterium]
QRPSEKYSQEIVDRQTAKIRSTLSVLDSAAINFKDPPLLGEIAVACARGYMEFRDIVPEWSGTYINLAKWYDDILERASFRKTAPE